MGTRTQVRVGVKTQLCQAPRDTAPEVWGMSASGQSQVYWGGGVNKKGCGVRCARTDRECSDPAGRAP